jgi:hypothetical protein
MNSPLEKITDNLHENQEKQSDPWRCCASELSPGPAPLPRREEPPELTTPLAQTINQKGGRWLPEATPNTKRNRPDCRRCPLTTVQASRISSMATESSAIEARQELEDRSPKRGHRCRLASHAREHQKGRSQGRTSSSTPPAKAPPRWGRSCRNLLDAAALPPPNRWKT